MKERILRFIQNRRAIRTRRTAFVGLCSLVILGLSGCGIGPFQFGHKNPNSPFVNRLNQLIMPIDGQFDAKTAPQPVYTNLKVYSADGKEVTLNAQNTPIFFEAYWCPHCQRTLVLFNENRKSLNQLPVIVSMGFVKGSTLKDAVARSKEEMKAFHLQDAKVYYYLGMDTNSVIPLGYPTLVFPEGGQIMTMAGEHSLWAWQQALNQ